MQERESLRALLKGVGTCSTFSDAAANASDLLIVENPQLARDLSDAMETNDEIPEQLFQAVDFYLESPWSDMILESLSKDKKLLARCDDSMQIKWITFGLKLGGSVHVRRRAARSEQP